MNLDELIDNRPPLVPPTTEAWPKPRSSNPATYQGRPFPNSVLFSATRRPTFQEFLHPSFRPKLQIKRTEVVSGKGNVGTLRGNGGTHITSGGNLKKSRPDDDGQDSGEVKSKVRKVMKGGVMVTLPSASEKRKELEKTEMPSNVHRKQDETLCTEIPDKQKIEDNDIVADQTEPDVVSTCTLTYGTASPDCHDKNILLGRRVDSLNTGIKEQTTDISIPMEKLPNITRSSTFPGCHRMPGRHISHGALFSAMSALRPGQLTRQPVAKSQSVRPNLKNRPKNVLLTNIPGNTLQKSRIDNITTANPSFESNNSEIVANIREEIQISCPSKMEDKEDNSSVIETNEIVDSKGDEVDTTCSSLSNENITENAIDKKQNCLESKQETSSVDDHVANAFENSNNKSSKSNTNDAICTKAKESLDIVEFSEKVGETSQTSETLDLGEHAENAGDVVLKSGGDKLQSENSTDHQTESDGVEELVFQDSMSEYSDHDADNKKEEINDAENTIEHDDLDGSNGEEETHEEPINKNIGLEEGAATVPAFEAGDASNVIAVNDSVVASEENEVEEGEITSESSLESDISDEEVEEPDTEPYMNDDDYREGDDDDYGEEDEQLNEEEDKLFTSKNTKEGEVQVQAVKSANENCNNESVLNSPEPKSLESATTTKGTDTGATAVKIDQPPDVEPPKKKLPNWLLGIKTTKPAATKSAKQKRQEFLKRMKEKTLARKLKKQEEKRNKHEQGGKLHGRNGSRIDGVRGAKRAGLEGELYPCNPPEPPIPPPPTIPKSLLNAVSNIAVDVTVAASEKELKRKTRGGNAKNQKFRKRQKKWNERQAAIAERDKRRVERMQNPLPQPICTFYMEGRCSKGEECTFRHEGPPRKQGKLCRFYKRGDCKHEENCAYMHSSFPCKYWHTNGRCKNGGHCRFSHDVLTDETKELLNQFLLEEKAALETQQMSNAAQTEGVTMATTCQSSFITMEMPPMECASSSKNPDTHVEPNPVTSIEPAPPIAWVPSMYKEI